MTEREIERLIAASRWREAAERCEASQDHARAEALYLKLFDRLAAARVARAEGREIDALRHLLEGRHKAEVEQLRQDMMSSLSGHIDEAIALLQRHRFVREAAELSASMGWLVEAAQLFADAFESLEAAQLYERIGRWREAEIFYAQHAQADPTSLEAHLGIGRVLQRFSRHMEALAPLAQAQTSARAQRDAEAFREARDRLAFSCLRLGWEEAARRYLGEEPLGVFEERFAVLYDVPAEGGISERYRIDGPYEGPFPEAYRAEDSLRKLGVVLQPLHGDDAQRHDYIQALQGLSEPSISGVPSLLDVNESRRFLTLGDHGGQPFVDWLAQSPGGGALRGVFEQLIGVIEAAHRRGVLHGHLQPQALRVRLGGGVVVLGFGLSTLGERQETHTEGEAVDSALRYLSPEGIFGSGLDLRSDFFGVGALLHRALTGEPPQRADASPHPRLTPAWQKHLGLLLASRPGERPENHASLRRWVASAPWGEASCFIARAAVTPRAAAKADRFEARGEPGDRRVYDRWLGREVIQLELPRALSVNARESLRRLSRPGAGVLQQVLWIEPEGTRLSLEVIDAPSLEEALPALTELERARVLRALMASIKALHEGGVSLGGLSLGRVRYKDGAPRIELSTSIQRLSEGGEASEAQADLDDLAQLQRTLLGGVERAPDALEARAAGFAERLGGMDRLIERLIVVERRRAWLGRLAELEVGGGAEIRCSLTERWGVGVV